MESTQQSWHSYSHENKGSLQRKPKNCWYSRYFDLDDKLIQGKDIAGKQLYWNALFNVSKLQ